MLKGSVIIRVFELRDGLKLFFEKRRNIKLFDCLNVENWIVRFKYLVDIF